MAKKQSRSRTVGTLGASKSDEPMPGHMKPAWQAGDPPIHRRTGARLAGNVLVWVEEAEHYLAMAVCNLMEHMYQPCSECLCWARDEITFALHMRRSTSDSSHPDLDSIISSRVRSVLGTTGEAGKVHCGKQKKGSVSKSRRATTHSHRRRTKKG